MDELAQVKWQGESGQEKAVVEVHAVTGTIDVRLYDKRGSYEGFQLGSFELTSEQAARLIAQLAEALTWSL